MKIIVLHGQDTAKSYVRLTKFIDTAKSRGWEIIYDEFPNTPSLFGAERLIIYRDFHLLTKNDIKNFEKFDGTLVVYHNSDLPSLFLKQMPPSFKMEKFDVPKLLFVFLESLYPGNSERCIKLLHEVVKSEPVELVFFFIARQMRDLYWVLNSKGESVFPTWKAGKLKSQAGKIGTEKLKELINLLAEIDVRIKSTKADLLTELDLMIIKQLE